MAKAFNSIKTGIEADDRVTFGKHMYQTWQFVSDTEPDYLIWCAGNTAHKFSYDLIVRAIKSKYLIQKKNKAEAKTIDEVYLDSGNYSGKPYAEEGSFEDCDIPF